MKNCPFTKEPCTINDCNLYDLKQDMCVFWLIVRYLEKISGGTLKR